MYVPKAFQQTDLAELHRFIERYSFAVLCSTGDDGVPFASHLPLLRDQRAAPPGALIGHMARANPQWRHADGKPVLAVFAGPHVYVSPSWYEAEDVVPTWNYVTVHVTGIFRAMHERDAMLEIVREMVGVYEAGKSEPWELGPPNDYLERMLHGIVGFRIEITGMEGKWKLSQNHPPERREKVMRALDEQDSEDAQAIVRLMRRMDG